MPHLILSRRRLTHFHHLNILRNDVINNNQLWRNSWYYVMVYLLGSKQIAIQYTYPDYCHKLKEEQMNVIRISYRNMF